MDVFKFTDIYEVLALHQHRKQLEEARHITFFRRKRKVVTTGCKLNSALVNQRLELVVLETIHHKLLVRAVALIVENEHTSEGV